MANFKEVNSDGKKYVEFDILASSNNPNVYLSAVVMYVCYESSVFGTNLKANKKITINKGAHFNKDDTYHIMYDDHDPTVFLVNLCSCIAKNKVKLSSTPTVMLQFRIELLGANFSNTDIYFFDPYIGNFATYTLTGNDPYAANYHYDKIFFYGATPVISTPLHTISKIAGIGDVLTIAGYNFGNSQGKVLFSDADNGGIFFLKGLDEQYYPDNGWNDTQIKVIVPSIVYKGYENDPLNYFSFGAGTGKIQVFTASGYSCMSDTEIKIPYSIQNRKTSTGVIQRVFLARTACNYDVSFTLHSEFSDPKN